MLRIASLTILSAALLAGCATGTATMAKSPATTMNGMLVGPTQMTLYVFDKDAAGKSMCNGGCATNWPPLMAPANATPIGDWSVVMRDDGSKQWAHKGKPLYTYAADKKAGDATGDNFKGVWHIVK